MTTPTQAQKEAAADAMEREMFAPHELPLDDELHAKYLNTAKVALTAAAEVGEFPEPTSEQIEARWSKKFADAVESIKRKERERCAQVAESTTYMSGAHIAAAIRALKK